MVPAIVCVALCAAALAVALLRFGRALIDDNLGDSTALGLLSLVLTAALVSGSIAIDDAMRRPMACAVRVEETGQAESAEVRR